MGAIESHGSSGFFGMVSSVGSLLKYMSRHLHVAPISGNRRNGDYFISHSHLSQSATPIFGAIFCVYMSVWISVSLHLAKLKIPVLLTSS